MTEPTIREGLEALINSWRDRHGKLAISRRPPDWHEADGYRQCADDLEGLLQRLREPAP